ncbi:MAG: 6-phosphogluconolactonase [Gammaproteobacteria bacterium]|jgi:6-phosphogluconolactonase
MVEDFRIFPDAEAVAQATADFLSARIVACVEEKQSCHVALPGGTTPARCLRLLSARSLPWHGIHWYLGDERCFPVGHPERNDSMIAQQLWSRIPMPDENRHPIPAELGPELAAAKYSALINRIDRLDIAVLGMGEDGHTASLFPGNAALDDRRAVVPVYHAPKPPAERVSLGLSTFQSAVLRIIMVTGHNKYEALARVKQGQQLPVSRIGPSCWFVDKSAADSDNI